MSSITDIRQASQQLAARNADVVRRGDRLGNALAAIVVLAGAIALGALLAGCGGGGDDDERRDTLPPACQERPELCV